MDRGTMEFQVEAMDLEERNAELEAENSQLRESLEHSKTVEQATGAISVRYRISPTKAYDMLREGAWSQGRTLHELASEVIEYGGSFAKPV